jgi:hypothetical protein
MGTVRLCAREGLPRSAQGPGRLHANDFSRSVANPDSAPMPAPGRPDAPDDEALVVEREPSTDEGKAVTEEPVMVPKHEPVMEEPVVMEEGAMVEGEVLVHES